MLNRRDLLKSSGLSLILPAFIKLKVDKTKTWQEMSRTEKKDSSC